MEPCSIRREILDHVTVLSATHLRIMRPTTTRAARLGLCAKIAQSIGRSGPPGRSNPHRFLADFTAFTRGRNSRYTQAPRHLVSDRNAIYGAAFLQRLRSMGIRDHPFAPRSPCQNPYAERLKGSIRRDCLDHFVVADEAHLRRILRRNADYYNRTQTHRSLAKDCPRHRPVQAIRAIFSAPLLDGLHQVYSRT